MMQSPQITGSGSPAPSPKASTVTAHDTHEMFIAVAIMIAFVYVSAVVAGLGRNAGRLVLTFFVGLLILQGTTHANPLAQFLANHPLTPGLAPTSTP